MGCVGMQYHQVFGGKMWLFVSYYVIFPRKDEKKNLMPQFSLINNETYFSIFTY